MILNMWLVGPYYRWNLKGIFFHVPIHILDKREVQLRKRTIVQLKVQWKHFEADEATQENESTMREAYPSLFHDFIMSP